jgi:hypothetical protein
MKSSGGTPSKWAYLTEMNNIFGQNPKVQGLENAVDRSDKREEDKKEHKPFIDLNETPDDYNNKNDKENVIIGS